MESTSFEQLLHERLTQLDVIPSHLVLNQVKRLTENLDMAVEPLLLMQALDTDGAVMCMEAHRHRTASKNQAERKNVFESIGQSMRRVCD